MRVPAARQSCPSWNPTTRGEITWTPPQKLVAADTSRGTSGHPTGIPKGRSRPPSTATSSTTSRRPECALCISPRSIHQEQCIRLFSRRMATWCPSTFRQTGERKDSWNLVHFKSSMLTYFVCMYWYIYVVEIKLGRLGSKLLQRWRAHLP